jgi:hypothetical protein
VGKFDPYKVSCLVLWSLKLSAKTILYWVWVIPI